MDPQRKSLANQTARHGVAVRFRLHTALNDFHDRA
jgi:hypothetical protein